MKITLAISLLCIHCSGGTQRLLRPAMAKRSLSSLTSRWGHPSSTGRDKRPAILSTGWDKRQAELTNSWDKRPAELTNSWDKRPDELTNSWDKRPAGLTNSWDKRQAGLLTKRGGADTVWQIKDCMTVSSKEEGTWEYRSDGRQDTCGLYLVTRPDQVVEVTLHDLTVDCDTGLVVMFDGWELNGNVFPGAEDHQLALEDRSQVLCSGNLGKGNRKHVFLSHQNAALVSFKIPKTGQGFRLSVKFRQNKDPCNILMSDMAGLFTLKTDPGQARNCSLTTLLFPASFYIQTLDVGTILNYRPGVHSRRRREGESGGGLSSQCSPDFVQLGGSSELQSSNLSTSHTLCGTQGKEDPAVKSLTVLCGSSTVRLVSSGLFSNEVTVMVKAATEDDLDFEHNMVMTCPEFMV